VRARSWPRLVKCGRRFTLGGKDAEAALVAIKQFEAEPAARENKPAALAAVKNADYWRGGIFRFAIVPVGAPWHIHHVDIPSAGLARQMRPGFSLPGTGLMGWI
jgi:hypothetical protein